MNEALSLRIASSHNGAYQSGMSMRRILSMRIDVHIRIFAYIRTLSAFAAPAWPSLVLIDKIGNNSNC